MKTSGMLGFGVAGAALLLCGLATGEDYSFKDCTKTKASKEDIEGAKGAHNAGQRFYDTGDYDRAIRSWRDAYDFDCTTHLELLNIASAYERKGDKQGAITALETYLARAKPADSGTIQERIKHLRDQLPANTAPTAPTSAPTAPPTASASGTVTTAPTGEPTAAPGNEGVRPYGVTPWIVAGGGAAVLVVGVVLLPVGIGKYNSANDACPDHSDCPDDVVSSGNSGRTLEGLGAVMVGVGGAAVVGGLVWQFVFNKPTSAVPTKSAFVSPRLSVTPLLSPSMQGATIHGAF